MSPLVRLGLALAAGVMLAVAGCGPGGPPRYNLSGTVTFNGRPLPGGQIIFTPAAAQGNTGPGSVAMIRDGQFATPPNLGVIGGPHVVEITGYSAAWGDVPDDQIEQLFPPHQLEVVLEAAHATIAFDVPPPAR